MARGRELNGAVLRLALVLAGTPVLAGAGLAAEGAKDGGHPAPGDPGTVTELSGGEMYTNKADLDGLAVRGAFGEKVTLDNKGLTFQDGDGDVKFRIGGRLQQDFGTSRLRTAPIASLDESRADSRRAWVEAYLTLYNALDIAFQYDFADTKTPINDAAIAYHGPNNFLFTVGNFKEPFSFNQLMSDTVTLFTERSLADAFAPARNFGFSVGTHGEQWTAAAGVFGGNANTGIDDNGIAGTARVTYAPILTKDQVLHLGIAGSYRSLQRDGADLSFSVRPESFLFRTTLVNTKTITNADDSARLGLEAAYQYGPVRVQGEYITTWVDRYPGGINAFAQRGSNFQGGYIEAGWTVNGKGRPYTLAPSYGAGYAVFGGVELEDSQRITKGGIGVFELGARVSFIDLTDRAIRGGTERDYTFGLNWYPDRNVRLMADYVRAHAENSAPTGRTVDADIFISRLQFYW